MHDLGDSTLRFDEELLLLADDHARATHAHPGDQRLGLKSKLMHHEQAYQRARSSKSSSAVDCNGLPSARVAIGHGDEVTNDLVFGT